MKDEIRIEMTACDKNGKMVHLGITSLSLPLLDESLNTAKDLVGIAFDNFALTARTLIHEANGK